MGAAESDAGNYGGKREQTENISVGVLSRKVSAPLCILFGIPRVLCVLALVTQFSLLDYVLIFNNGLIWLFLLAIDLVVLTFVFFILFITFEYKHMLPWEGAGNAGDPEQSHHQSRHFGPHYKAQIPYGFECWYIYVFLSHSTSTCHLLLISFAFLFI